MSLWEPDVKTLNRTIRQRDALLEALTELLGWIEKQPTAYSSNILPPQHILIRARAAINLTAEA